LAIDSVFIHLEEKVVKPRRYTEKQFIAAVQSSFSIRQVLRNLGLSPTGCNYKTVHVVAARLGLDTSHFTGQGHLRGKAHSWTPKRALEEILVENSPMVGTSSLKKRLLKEGVLVNHCYECGSPPVWQGKPLVMVLDHKNGNRLDNRLDNLRLLCPNCNSQQTTFAGKNKGRYNPAGGIQQSHET
jgi:HNH endonuclease